MVQIGVQMFTVREYTKTVEGIIDSCKKVKAMGYDGIQASAMGPIEPTELKKILDDLGLKCAATHVSLDRMLDETQAVIDEHQALDCSYTAIGGFFPKAEEWSLDNWLSFIDKFNTAAEKFKGSAVQLGYHNHSHEFAQFDGKTVMQIMLEKFDPSIWFEIDTYWVSHGGGDPVQWIEKVAGRIPCVHYKDLVISGADRSHLMCEIGSGNLNWPAINDACAKADVEWYLVERDSGLLDPFESLQISIKNMRAMGL